MFEILLTVLFTATSWPPVIQGQWIPFMDTQQEISPFTHPLTDSELILPKQRTTQTNIPIIVLLKPRSAKGLNGDNTGPEDRPALDHRRQASTAEWLGMPVLSDSTDNNDKNNNINQQMFDSDNDYRTEPFSIGSDQRQEASDEDKVTVKGRGVAGEQIQWPTFNSKDQSPPVSPETLASISQLLPRFSALSQSSQTELAQMAQKSSSNGAAFEEVLKKFTSNLTDLEHRVTNEDAITEGETNSSGGEDKQVTTSEYNMYMINENRSSGSVKPKSSANEAIESNDNSNTSDEEKSHSFTGEQRDTNDNDMHYKNHQSLVPEKSTPFINERKRFKIPVKLEEQPTEPQSGTDMQSGFRPIAVNKGWNPIKPKPKPKTKPKHKPKPQIKMPSNRPEEHQYLHKERNTVANHYNVKSPETIYGIPSTERDIFRPRHYHQNLIPSQFDTRHTIRHLPFHKYASYLTETELSPTLMALDMTGDANKPQHIEPKPEQQSAMGQDIKKDIIEEKIQLIDQHKHLIDEKTMIIDDKQSMGGQEGGLGGEEVSGGIGQQLTCCDILNGQNNGGAQAERTPEIHEEVIKTDWDDDEISTLGGIHQRHHHNLPLPLPEPIVEHHYEHHFPKHYQKLQCHPEPSFGASSPEFHWPKPMYRRPIYRPKLFYKPLFFG